MATMKLLLTTSFFCLLGASKSVTDKEFKELSDLVHHQASMIEEKDHEVKDLSALVYSQAAMIEQQSMKVQELAEENERQNRLIRYLLHNDHDKLEKELEIEPGQFQNSSLEERVELLETQMVVVQDKVSNQEADIKFLFGEKIIQDERLLNLEVVTDNINAELVIIDDELEDFEGTISKQENRLTEAEENIRGLWITDVELDTRVTSLEKSVDSKGTIGFHTALTSYSSIVPESAVLFNEVLINDGDGYDSRTGTFTVPSGGDGSYYFSTYLVVMDGQWGLFDIVLNGKIICTAYGDQREATADNESVSCSALADVMEGDTVQVVYRSGTNNNPLEAQPSYLYDGFTGFRI